jgi:hypothetical protein
LEGLNGGAHTFGAAFFEEVESAQVGVEGGGALGRKDGGGLGLEEAAEAAGEAKTGALDGAGGGGIFVEMRADALDD